MLVNELTHVQNSDRKVLNDKLIRDGVRVNLAVLCVQELCSADDHGRWHEHLELVLRGDLGCLEQGEVPGQNGLRRYFIHFQSNGLLI